MRLDDVKRVLQGLGPRSLKRLGSMRLSTVVLQESRRAKKRVSELKTRYPSAAARELAQHLIEQKKQVAALVGGISGAFGLVGIPADWVAMAVLEVQLLVDIATAYEVRLEFARSTNCWTSWARPTASARWGGRAPKWWASWPKYSSSAGGWPLSAGPFLWWRRR
jgi:hypothetical protein